MQPSSPDRWLNRIVKILAACLLALLCALMWRVVIAVDRVADDLEHVTAAADRVADRVDSVSERIENIEKKMGETFNAEEVRGLLAEAGRIGPEVVNGDGPNDTRTEAEIEYLFDALREADARYAFDDESHSPRRFVTKLRAKYRLYRGAIGTTEDFIEKIAARTVTGKPYAAIGTDGTIESVRDLLVRLLNKHREAAEKRRRSDG